MNPDYRTAEQDEGHPLQRQPRSPMLNPNQDYPLYLVWDLRYKADLTFPVLVSFAYDPRNPDYRTTKAGQRRFDYPRFYRVTVAIQTLLWRLGLPCHNRFSDECTPDFSCCAAKPQRLELRFVTYAEGELLIREGWTLAKEEDQNRQFGMVYLERLG